MDCLEFLIKEADAVCAAYPAANRVQLMKNDMRVGDRHPATGRGIGKGAIEARCVIPLF